MNNGVTVGLVRAATLATRSLMNVIFAVLLTSKQFGEFSLIVTIVSYGILVMGLDLYVYTTREIVSAPKERILGLILGHVAVICCGYFVLSLPLWLYLETLNLNTNLLKIILILIIEHLNQEGYRLLVSFGKTTLASVALLLRSAAWVWFVVPILYTTENDLKLNIILNVWLFFSAVALSYIIFNLRKEVVFGQGKPIPWDGFKKSIVTVSGFWVSTISYKMTSVGDRFILAALGGVSLLGPYSLAFSISALGAAFYEPVRLETRFSANSKMLSQYGIAFVKDDLTKELKYSWYFGAAFSTVVLFGTLLLKNIFQNNSNFNFSNMLIFSCSLYGGLSIPHSAANYILYLLKSDRKLLSINYLSLVVFGLVSGMVIYMKAPLVIMVAPLLAMFFMSILKNIEARKLIK